MFEGTHGVLEVGTKTDSTVRPALGDAKVALAGKPTTPGAKPPAFLVDMCRRELMDFRDAIRDGRAPLVTGTDGRKSGALIEACY